MDTLTPTTSGCDAASGSDLHRPTLLAVRLRIIEMYKSCEELANRCAKEEGGNEMAGHLHEQAFGLRKARMMLGTMLDEQAGMCLLPRMSMGVSDMPPLLQGRYVQNDRARRRGNGTR